jgi:hypothetical protein
MEKIKGVQKEVLDERCFPISLDVENMFHNIPRSKALESLHDILTTSSADLCSIPPRDIVQLVEVCIACNHFKHGNKIYLQTTGLPMGNRLSGILAEIFMRTQ